MKLNLVSILVISLLVTLTYADYCDINCEKCKNEDVCETCVPDLSRHLDKKSGKCVCDDGFKENVREVCESEVEYINILLLIFCIIMILLFVFYIIRIEKINPLDLCNMLKFKHYPINNQHRQLQPLSETNQTLQPNNLTTNLNTDHQLASTQKNMLVKEDQEQDRSQAVENMKDFIGQDPNENDNKPQTPEDNKSGVIGADDGEEEKQESDEEEEEEDDDEEEEDDDEISDFGDDDEDKGNLDEEDQGDYEFEDDIDLDSPSKKSYNKDRTESQINVEDLESQSIQLKSVKSMKSSKRNTERQTSQSPKKGNDQSEIDLGQSSVMQKSQAGNNLLSGGNTIVIQDDDYDFE